MTFQPPKHVGAWIIENKLGEGGQAVTFRARRGTGTTDAAFVVKVLKPWGERSGDRTEEGDRRRFLAEVETIGILRKSGCPNIVEVIDADLQPASGQPWYVLPYYRGGAMWDGRQRRYAEEYSGNLDRVLSIAASIARTLAHMHELGFVHRDVKTGNIFFAQPGGVPVLGDFGIVHAPPTPEDGVRTGARERLGPGHWRPPELHAGSLRNRDPKSDVYLLGGVIYEALCGGEWIEETQQSDGSFTHEQPSFRLERVTSNPRAQWITVLLRHMLARDPDARISAAQVAESCDKIRDWKPAEASPILLPSNVVLDLAAATYCQRSRETYELALRDELKAICDRVEQRFGMKEWAPKGKPTRMVTTNIGDVDAFEYARRVHSGSVWAAVRILVAFETEKISPTRPTPMRMSYAFVGRTNRNEEIVAVFTDTGEWRERSRSVPGDPGHEELLAVIAKEELERLSILIARDIEALL